MYFNHTNNTYHILDIEGDLIPSTQVWCAVVKTIVFETDGTRDVKESVKFRPADLPKLCDFINEESRKENTYFVGHNLIGYDAPTLVRLHNVNLPPSVCVDTLVLSYLFNPSLKGGHSLKAWGERFGDEKIEFNDFSKFSEEQLEYCAQDVEVTLKLFLRLTARMRKIGFSELSAYIEHHTRHITDQQKVNGVKFNERKARELLAFFEGRKGELEASIHEVFPPRLEMVKEYEYRTRKDGTPYKSYENHVFNYPEIRWNPDRTRYRTYEYRSFNIGSPKQRVDRLQELGWTPTQLTPKGNPKLTEDSLELFIENDRDAPKQALLISEWITVNSRILTLREWLGSLHDDGRIHGTLYTCGAQTRRMRHTEPNTGNIVGNDKPWGEDLRSCWEASDGLVMVGVDAKGLEARVLVDYLAVQEAIDTILEGDIHQLNRDAIAEAIGNPEKSRKTSKNDFYAFLYGAGNPKLGLMNNGGPSIGKKIREALMDTVPGLKDLISRLEDEWESNDKRLETIDGGWVVCNFKHAILNYKCQSAGAILMKLALVLLWEKIDHNRAWLLLNVHDEWQFEAEPDYAEELATICCDAITEAGEQLGFKIKMEGSYDIGKNWAETH